jgi:signal recognition particle subunit SRP72
MAVESVKLACTSNTNFEVSQPSSYATLFNLACLQIAQKNYEGAIVSLDLAADQCSSVMKMEGSSDEDIERELLIILSQKAYVDQKMGRISVALADYQKVLGAKKIDPVISAIATNNYQVLKGAQDVVEVSKALKFINTPSILAKLNSSQIFLVEFNALIYSILVGKTNVAISKISQLMDRLNGQDPRKELVLYVQGQLMRKQKGWNLQSVQNFASASSSSIAAQFLLLDQLMKQSSWHAFELLLKQCLSNESFSPYVPGLVSVLVWLLERNSNPVQALELLEKHSNAASPQELSQLAFFKLLLGKYEEAYSDFETLFGMEDKLHNKAGYLLCMAETHPFNCESLMALVESEISIGDLPVAENLEELECLIGKTSKKLGNVDDGVKKKKRRQKPLPKGYDPKKIPDPSKNLFLSIDRWLPKAQRELAQKKILKKEKEMSGFGFQGVALSGGGIGTTGSARIAGLKPQKLANSLEAVTKQDILDASEVIPPTRPQAAKSKKKKSRK